MADIAHGSDTIHPTRILVGVTALVATVVVLGLAWFAVAGAGTLEVPNLSTQPQLVGHLLLASAVILATVGLLHDSEGYLAGLWVVSTMGPWIAAAVGIGTYILTAGWDMSVNVRFAAAYNGVAAATAALAALAFLGRQLSRPERAQPRTWEGLVDRQTQLQARIIAMKKSNGQLSPDARGGGGPAPRGRQRAPVRPRRVEAGAPLGARDGLLERAAHPPPDRRDRRPRPAERSGRDGDAVHDALSLSGSTIADHEVLPPGCAPPSRRSRPTPRATSCRGRTSPPMPGAQVLDDPPTEDRGPVGAAGGPVRDQRVPRRPGRRPDPLAEPAAVGRPHGRDHGVPRARARPAERDRRDPGGHDRGALPGRRPGGSPEPAADRVLALVGRSRTSDSISRD